MTRPTLLTPADHRRRQLGMLFIGFALLQLIVGLTVLRHRLEGLWFLLYWLVCMGSTCMALLIALLDMLILRERIRRERKKLVQNTVHSIIPHLPEHLRSGSPPNTSPPTESPRHPAEDGPN